MATHSSIPAWRIPWTGEPDKLQSMGFSGQGYWSGLPCPPPGDLPNPGIEPRSPTLQEDPLLSEPPGKYIEVCIHIYNGTPLQHSCLENPTDRGAWWASVHGVPKSRT